LEAEKYREEIGNCCVFCPGYGGLMATGKNAESFGEQAIDVLNNQPSSRGKAWHLVICLS
jgi:hypothetical protein